MPYTQATIRRDLEALHVSAWDWPGDNPKGGAGTVSKEAALDEISGYCWCAYEKALHATGDQVIGRVQHLNAAGLYEKVAEIVGKETLFGISAKGNLLKMDKWATVMNDSWILGGVHRSAKFRLASPRVMENLWNFSQGIPVVTAREICGLVHFGYALQQVGPWQILSLSDRTRAARADLLEYDRCVKSGLTIRGALSLVDKTRLKPV